MFHTTMWNATRFAAPYWSMEAGKDPIFHRDRETSDAAADAGTLRFTSVHPSFDRFQCAIIEQDK